jgi:hypothetical protein
MEDTKTNEKENMKEKPRRRWRKYNKEAFNNKLTDAKLKEFAEMFNKKHRVG